jgi:hypothetical protein
MFLFIFIYAISFDLLILLNLDLDSDVSDVQVLNERVEQAAFGYNLSIAALALQQDHLRNQNKEDRFLISGLKQSGRPAVGLAPQKYAGQLIMSSLLDIVFHGSSRPVIWDVIVVNGPIQARNGPCLPTLIFVFDSPAIAKLNF